jgi:hypothetical protein
LLAINAYTDWISKQPVAKQADLQKALSAAVHKHIDKDLPAKLLKMRDSIMLAQHSAEFNDSTKLFSAPKVAYNVIAKKIDMGSLLTFSFNPGYDYNHQNIDSTSFTITYLKGFGNYQRPYNLDLSAEGLLLRDTVLKTHNSSRHELMLKAGVNKTLVADEKSNPLIEIEAQFEDDDHFHSPLYKSEENNIFTFNTILTVHLSSSLALPITLKYDLKKPNLFGIFNLAWNFQTSKASSTDNK